MDTDIPQQMAHKPGGEPNIKVSITFTFEINKKHCYPLMRRF